MEEETASSAPLGISAPIGFNLTLGEAVADLTDQLRDRVGAPLSGKTSTAHDLSKRFNLRLITVEAMISEAVKAAEEFTATQAAAAAANPDAPAAPVPPLKAELGLKFRGSQIGAVAAAAAAAANPDSPAAPVTLLKAELGLKVCVCICICVFLATAASAAAANPNAPVIPLKAELGLKVQAARAEVTDVPDEVIARLVVLGMEEASTWSPAPEPEVKGKAAPKPPKGAPPPEPDPPQGFVLDGFPASPAQAQLMEKMLTGLDLKDEQARCNAASRLAPPPSKSLPIVQRPLSSGLDAVQFANYNDDETHLMDVWLKRFDRLRYPIDGSGPLADIHTSASDVASAILRSVRAAASTRSAGDGTARARAAYEEVRALAQNANLYAEATARHLLTAKELEIVAQALITDPKNPPPACAEIIKFAAATKAAEQLKICSSGAMEASAFAEQAARTGAMEAAQKTEAALKLAVEAVAHMKTLTTEAARTGATEAAQKAEAALKLAEEAVAHIKSLSAPPPALPPNSPTAAEAARTGATEAAQKAAAALKLAEEAVAHIKALSAPPPAAAETNTSDSAAQDGVAVANVANDAAAVVAESEEEVPTQDVEWRGIEGTYMDSMAAGFASVYQEVVQTETHYEQQLGSFKAMLAHPDKRPAMVAGFQVIQTETHYEHQLGSFKAMLAHPDKRPAMVAGFQDRKRKEVRAGMLMRAEDLREMLWEESDRKMKEAETERSNLAADGFVPRHRDLYSQHYTRLLQTEVNRYYASIHFANAYTLARYGVKKDPLPPGLLEAPNLLSGKTSDWVREEEESMSGPSAEGDSDPEAAAKGPGAGAGEGAVAEVVAARPRTGEGSTGSESPRGESTGREGAVAGERATEATDATVEVESVDQVMSPAQHEAVAAEVLHLGDIEAGLFRKRAILLAQHARASMQAVEEAAQRSQVCLYVVTARASMQAVEEAAQRSQAVEEAAQRSQDVMSEWVKERYSAECDSAWAVDKAIKDAAFEERALEEVQDTNTTIVEAGGGEADSSSGAEPVRDDELQMGQVVRLPSIAHDGALRSAPHIRMPPTAVLSVEQLEQLVKKLTGICPSGFLAVDDAVELLSSCIAEEMFPDMWRDTTREQLMSMLRQMLLKLTAKSRK
eukprot:gene3481-13543_t